MGGSSDGVQEDANIVWLNGNDFQTWRNASGRRTRPRRREGHSVGGQDAPPDRRAGVLRERVSRRHALATLIGSTPRTPTARRTPVQREYNRPSFLPVVMIEAGSSPSRTAGVSRGDPAILRRQEYWSMLSGATGQFYGNHYTWQFIDGWKSHLNTRAARTRSADSSCSSRRPWFRLVPDTRSTDFLPRATARTRQREMSARATT